MIFRISDFDSGGYVFSALFCFELEDNIKGQDIIRFFDVVGITTAFQILTAFYLTIEDRRKANLKLAASKNAIEIGMDYIPHGYSHADFVFVSKSELQGKKANGDWYSKEDLEFIDDRIRAFQNYDTPVIDVPGYIKNFGMNIQRKKQKILQVESDLEYEFRVLHGIRAVLQYVRAMRYP